MAAIAYVAFLPFAGHIGKVYVTWASAHEIDDDFTSSEFHI